MSPKSNLNSCQSNIQGLALGASKNSNQSAGQRDLGRKPVVLQKNNSGQPQVQNKLCGRDGSEKSDKNQALSTASRLVKNTSIKSDEQQTIKKKSPSQNEQDPKKAHQLRYHSQVVRNHSYTKSQGQEEMLSDDKRSQGTVDKIESLHAPGSLTFNARSNCDYVEQRKKDTFSDSKHAFQQFGEQQIGRLMS